ncbi:hypothetical protein FJZ40_04180 [Candidatus Shapirobacteria bacterium]|nr:hypothetical protein [Candidatus Shapirobacteria bacterium]
MTGVDSEHEQEVAAFFKKRVDCLISEAIDPRKYKQAECGITQVWKYAAEMLQPEFAPFYREPTSQPNINDYWMRTKYPDIYLVESCEIRHTPDDRGGTTHSTAVARRVVRFGQEINENFQKEHPGKEPYRVTIKWWE